MLLYWPQELAQDDFTAIFIDLSNRNMGGEKGKRELQKLYTSAFLAEVVYMDAQLKEVIMGFYLKEYTGMKLNLESVKWGIRILLSC